MKNPSLDPFEIRSEFEHSSARMGDAIANLRELVDEQRAAIENLRLCNDNQREQLEERGKIINIQEQEVENLSRQAVETKEILAAMQHKLLAAGDDNLKISEELSASLRSRLSEEQRHIAYVEKVMHELEAAERNLDAIQDYRRTIRQLTEENTRLHMIAMSKWIWRKPLCLAATISAKLSRRKTTAMITARG